MNWSCLVRANRPHAAALILMFLFLLFLLRLWGVGPLNLSSYPRLPNSSTNLAANLWTFSSSLFCASQGVGSILVLHTHVMVSHRQCVRTWTPSLFRFLNYVLMLAYFPYAAAVVLFTWASSVSVGIMSTSRSFSLIVSCSCSSLWCS